MNIMHFSDERIAQIRAGSPLTPEEREFLVTDPPRFEECQPEREPELRAERDAQRVALREIRDTDCGCDDDYGPCPSCIARAALAEGAEPLSSAEVATVARTAAIAARALTEGADGPREERP